MATMTIDHNYFETQAQVMEDIAKTGFWPTTYVSGESPELPLHYHNHDIIGYLVQGEGYLLDENKNRVDIRAGARLNIPKGAWHAEGAVDQQMTYIVTIRDPIPFFEALMPVEPQGPMPDFSTLNSRI